MPAAHKQGRHKGRHKEKRLGPTALAREATGEGWMKNWNRNILFGMLLYF
jgi:hypothetical protein